MEEAHLHRVAMTASLSGSFARAGVKCPCCILFEETRGTWARSELNSSTVMRTFRDYLAILMRILSAEGSTSRTFSGFVSSNAPYLNIRLGQLRDDFRRSIQINRDRPSLRASQPSWSEPLVSPASTMMEALAISAIVLLRMTKFCRWIGYPTANWETAR